MEHPTGMLLSSKTSGPMKFWRNLKTFCSLLITCLTIIEFPFELNDFVTPLSSRLNQSGLSSGQQDNRQ